jgi:hypothetical protein
MAQDSIVREDKMKKYKVRAVETVTSTGWYEAENEEEAIEKFRLDSIKLDYTTAYPIGYMTTGWSPVATEDTE